MYMLLEFVNAQQDVCYDCNRKEHYNINDRRRITYSNANALGIFQNITFQMSDNEV